MAIEFVLCRRKDDHTVTTKIARRALDAWPDWEPIPTEDETADQPSPTAPEAEEPAREKTTAPKSRSRAATDSKE